MTHLNPTYETELQLKTRYFIDWMTDRYQDYLEEDGSIDVEGLARRAADNFGILLQWAQDMAAEVKRQMDGVK